MLDLGERLFFPNQIRNSNYWSNYIDYLDLHYFEEKFSNLKKINKLYISQNSKPNFFSYSEAFVECKTAKIANTVMRSGVEVDETRVNMVHFNGRKTVIEGKFILYIYMCVCETT